MQTFNSVKGFGLLLLTYTFSCLVFAETYSASVTLYGSRFGDGNCNTITTACGFYTYPGYSAAVSQNLFGAGPGQGAGPACETCWYLTANRDVNGNPFPNGNNNYIVVKVTNLCPTSSPHCSTNSNGVNDWGQQVNFDLCDDSGAGAALLTNQPGGPNAGLGWATRADCSAWYGADHYS